MLWELSTAAVIAFGLDKKGGERNVLIFDLGGLAAVSVAEVGVIIFEKLMNLLLHLRIHQHMHQRNIARVLLPILVIIIAAVVAVILGALMNRLIHQHMHQRKKTLVLFLIYIIIVTLKAVVNRKFLLETNLTNKMVHLIFFVFF